MSPRRPFRRLSRLRQARSRSRRPGSFSAVVPFSEAGHGPWTATVDYGDGSAVEAATVGDDQTVHLAHHYATGGSYTVIVRVTDSAGRPGSGISSSTCSPCR